jgi:hypothetical protein
MKVAPGFSVLVGAALEGSFAVRSSPGEGTTVEARIPCE